MSCVRAVLVQNPPAIYNLTTIPHTVQFTIRQQYITSPQHNTQVSSRSASST